jgi:hypothetical protein
MERAPGRDCATVLRRWIIGSALLALTLLAGCGVAVRTGYNQAPSLGTWWLDGYFGFSTEQSSRVRQSLSELMTWHRRQELPVYAQLLQKAQLEVLSDATPAQLCRWAEVLDERFEALMREALPRMAPLASSFSATQLQQLQTRYEESNREFSQKYLQPSAEKRLQNSIERAIGNAERLYGRLGASQKQTVAEVVRAAPFDTQAWDKERRARQGEVLALLRELGNEKASDTRALAALQGLGERMQRRSGVDGQAQQQRLTQLNCERAARIHNSTTPAQRQRAAQWLKGWEDDVRALASQPPPASRTSTPEG